MITPYLDEIKDALSSYEWIQFVETIRCDFGENLGDVRDILTFSKIFKDGFELWVVIATPILLSLQTCGTSAETLLVFLGDANRGWRKAKGIRLKDFFGLLNLSV